MARMVLDMQANFSKICVNNSVFAALCLTDLENIVDILKYQPQEAGKPFKTEVKVHD